MSAEEFDATIEYTADPKVFTHHIGDVTCVLMVPAGCPVPEVDLYVHTHSTTPDERAVAVDALGLGSQLTKWGSEAIWRNRTFGTAVRATVFLLPSDEDAQVAA